MAARTTAVTKSVESRAERRELPMVKMDCLDREQGCAESLAKGERP